jgi:hypothetical protein
MDEATPTYDVARKRPLEIRIRDIYDEGGGISELEARRLSSNRLPADAIYMIRALIDDGRITLQQFHIVGGEQNFEMSLELLFNMWVALSGDIVKKAVGDDLSEEMKRKRRFLQAVLFKLRLDSAFVGLQDGLSPEEAVAQADELIPIAQISSTASAPEPTPPMDADGEQPT